MTTAAAIIAGGQSHRMGGVEKAFVEINGKSILDWIIARLAPQVERLVINANGDAARYQGTGLSVIADLRRDVGTPLAGLHASLHWAKINGFGRLLTVPSDAPFLPIDLVNKLAAVAQPAAIAASGGQSHFLTGLWPSGFYESLDDAITKEKLFRVKNWVVLAKAVTVTWPVVPFDPFFNVNTSEELVEARRIAAEYAP